MNLVICCDFFGGDGSRAGEWKEVGNEVDNEKLSTTGHVSHGRHGRVDGAPLLSELEVKCYPGIYVPFDQMTCFNKPRYYIVLLGKWGGEAWGHHSPSAQECI